VVQADNITDLIISIIYGFGWAVLVMMFDFSTRKGEINSWYYAIISNLTEHARWLFKVLGGCPVCFGLWFSVPAFVLMDAENYFIFLMASQFVLIKNYVSTD